MENEIKLPEKKIELPEKKMKTLANCDTREFLKQANRIRKKAAEFYANCNFGAIRSEKPNFPEGADDDQKAAIVRKLFYKKIDKVLDICLEENVDGTLEILGMMCFMSKEETAKLEADVLLGLALDLIASERVINFLSKMAKSGLLFTDES